MKNNITTCSANKSKPLYSVLFISISAALLAGCQSTGHNTQSNITPSDHAAIINDPQYLSRVASNTSAYQALFTEDDHNVDVNAHRRLLKSLHKHLTSDHVAVTQVRHHAVPFINDDSVDALSDSLLRTVFETFAAKLDEEDYSSDDYDDEGSYEVPYRDEDSYLEEPSALYLNYIDENENKLPNVGYDIDRQTGMSEDFIAATNRAIAYVDTSNDCVLDYSYDLDGLVSDNLSLTTDSSDVQPLKKTYSDCVSQTKKQFSEILTSAKGYQSHYINAQNACVQQFDRDLGHILSPSRSVKKLDYDLYDSVFESYDVCHDRVSNLHILEPANYISYGLSKQSLDYQKGLVACAGDLESARKALAVAGKTYNNAPQDYADAYYDFSACDAESYTQVYYSDDPEDTNHEYSADAAAAAYEVDAAQEVRVEDFEADDFDTENYDTQSHDTSEYAAEEDYDSDSEYDLDSEMDSEIESEEQSAREDREYSGLVGKLFNWFKRTPAQIAASNQYNYQYLTLNSVSQFNARNKQLDSVYSYDFVSPTMLTSIQLPVGIDFNAAKITVDPSAVLPIIALANPENAPLPQQLTATTVRFNMPEELATQLPANVVYDSFVDAIEKSLEGLDSEYFTAVDIAEDPYAKQLGASKAIKVNFGSKATGEMVGGIIKHLSQNLETYVTAHPDQFPDESRIKASIDKWQENNSRYQIKDAGSILQLIEAVGPISFNKVNYYYLDRSDRLLGKQVRTLVGGDFLGAKSTFLSRTRYDQASFTQHPLAALFSQSFGPAATKPIDGNSWLKEIKDQQYKLEQARYARYDYERESRDDDDDSNDYDNHDHDSNDNDDYSNESRDDHTASSTLSDPSEYERRTIRRVNEPAVKTVTKIATNDNHDAVSAD